MGDELVDKIAAELDDLAFANGVNRSTFHPFVSAIVDRLRYAGVVDAQIEKWLGPASDWSIAEPSDETEDANPAD